MNFNYLFLLLCFPLVLSAQKSDSVRYSNIGFSLGSPQQFAYPADNSSGYYLTNGPLFYSKSYNFAFSGQWYRANSWGFSLELGLRQYFAAFRESKGQSTLNGSYKGDFQARSGYAAPLLMYNVLAGNSAWFNLLAGAELHASFGATAYQYEQGTFFFDPASGYVLLRLGTEYTRRINSDLQGSVYFNLTQGLDETATLSLAADTGFEAEHLGSYWGTGFEFGIRLSICWEYGETAE